jgi:acyl-CoA thioesterase-1
MGSLFARGATAFGICLFCILNVGSANAATHKIVAIGASNTYGYGKGAHSGGVSSSQAFPARLEALLRARGIDAQVINAGVQGDTAAGIAARLDSAVPDGTEVVILDPAYGNDDGANISAGAVEGYVGQIRSRLSARHIAVIVLPRLVTLAGAANRDPDGQHFNAQGHARIASYLDSRVMASLKTK